MTYTKNFIEIYFVIGMFVNFALFVVQAAKLFKGKDSTGLSFITFFGFNLIQLSTVLHGIVVHDVLLTVGYLLSLIACGMVTIMIPLYKRRAVKT